MESINFFPVEGEAFGYFETDFIVIGSDLFFFGCNYIPHLADVAPPDEVNMNDDSIHK